MDTAGLKRVYRFFATEAEIFDFLKGKWQGSGIHGCVGALPEEGVFLRACFSEEILFLQLRSMRKKLGRKALASFFQKRVLRSSAIQSGIKKTWDLSPLSAKLQVDVDLVIFYWSKELQLAIQALDEKRVHCQLELVDAKKKQIFFSGILERKTSYA